MVCDPRSRVVVSVSSRNGSVKDTYWQRTVGATKRTLVNACKGFISVTMQRAQLVLQASDENPIQVAKRDIENGGWIMRGQLLLLLKSAIVQLMQDRLIGDREELVKVRYRYRYTFGDYCLDILPIGLTHHAIKLLLVHPIDTMVVRMNVPAIGDTRSCEPVECADQLYRNGGWKSFYKGYTAALAHYVLNRFAFYCFFDLFKCILIRDTRIYPEWQFKVVQAHASILADLVAYPLDTVRVNMMADAGKVNPKYVDPVDCAKQIVAEKGVKGLFKGFSITVLRQSWRWYCSMLCYMQ